MTGVSPTAEGFRAAFRRPSLTLAEIAWRWTVGATAAAIFFFGVFEYLYTLPVTSGELRFLRSRQPYLVAEAIAHIFRGTLNRAAVAGMLAGLLLAALWGVAGSFGRIAIVRGLIDYFRKPGAGHASAGGGNGERDIAGHVSTNAPASCLTSLIRLNFLRVTVALAATVAVAGAWIVAGLASPDADPQPGLAFLLFLPLAGLVFLAWYFLNWLLSVAGMFAVRDRKDAAGAISAAMTVCREHTGAVFAVSAWTGFAHLVAFVGAAVIASLPLALAGALPWRLVLFAMAVATLAYFAVADWLSMARLAGYVCIIEMPEEVAPLPPVPQPPVPPPVLSSGPPVQTAIDRDEPILSDVSDLAVEP